MSLAFLNVDLEIESDQPLHLLKEKFGDDVMVLYCGERHPGFLLSLETTACKNDPASMVAEFCRIVRSLDEQGKALWDGASRRTFDIGYEAGLNQRSLSWEGSAELVAMAAEIGAWLAITIYEADDPSNA